ncbi:GlcG/HbpS family heme-binding protein [Marinobacterium aestuariivivens]|uniref:Heme-binding protein n=1 Tax=Marinobacterium aestuariivivens TaxID=1698799 RepID=A0ABW2A726_9GAMM
MKKLMLIPLLLAGSHALADQPRLAVVSHDQARELAAAAVAECQAQGYAVSAAVVDRSGVLAGFSRHEQAGPHTVTSAQGKAFTAASMGRPTGDIAKAVAGNAELEGLRDMHPNLLILNGGLPLKVGDAKIGGIGVGGAPGGHLDAACAQAAIDKVLGA